MCRFLFPPVIIFYLSLSGDHFVHGSHNYPASFLNPKPCARMKNVILYRQPICVDDGHGGYIPETVANCQGSFKQTCPEFNQAECMRYGKDNRACCRLKYYAERKTWMEVYYSMQYDSTQYDGKINPNDIIEIHRLIKKPEDFGNRHQEDYPNNVQDPSGERGLKWYYVDQVKDSMYYFMELSTNHFNPNNCLENKGTPDDTCSIKGYLADQYPEGFDPKSHKIELSKYEKDNNAVVTTTFSDPRCITILINRTVVGACQVVYTRESYTEAFWTNFTVSEINFYRDPKNKSEDSPVRARYAYYPVEDKEMRDQIFSGPSQPTTTAGPNLEPEPEPEDDEYE